MYLSCALACILGIFVQMFQLYCMYITKKNEKAIHVKVISWLFF